jgi:uncharacterized protein YlxW (UPF0749 family)
MPDRLEPAPHRADWRARLRAAVATGGWLRGGGPAWWRVAAPLVFVVAGTLFVTSWVSAGGQDLRAGRYDDLPGLAAAQAGKLESLRAEQEKLAAEVDGLTEGLADSIGARQAQQDARAAERPAGLDPARGAGVTITLDDAPDAVPDNVTDKVNNLVVHQQDIQAVVNALWAGGAEAMTIQDQRVVSTTGIRCVGNTVVLHDVPYAPPYVIKAVGPTDEMLSSLNQSPYIGFYLQAVAAYQLGWDVQVTPDMQLPGYTGSIELDYARPAGGTGDLPDDRT